LLHFFVISAQETMSGLKLEWVLLVGFIAD